MSDTNNTSPRSHLNGNGAYHGDHTEGPKKPVKSHYKGGKKPRGNRHDPKLPRPADEPKIDWTRPICLRNGWDVVVHTHDGVYEERPVVGEWRSHRQGSWELARWTPEGFYAVGNVPYKTHQHIHDIVNKRPTRHVWSFQAEWSDGNLWTQNYFDVATRDAGIAAAETMGLKIRKVWEEDVPTD